ncbi:histidine kinase [Streptomyces sp. NPDC050803]|uniref:histidine kinase n=1 Tax=Streptomyces sp. NPDC050803 TaxID=3154635 RepID=UPI0034490C63
MSPRSWITPLVARLRTTNPYVVDAALAALVLFAVSLQWLFPDEGDDVLTWQGWLLGAATAVPLVWRRRAPMTTACLVSVATPAMAVYHAPPPDVSYGGLVVLYTMAARGPAWQRRLMLVGWLIGTSLTMQHKENALPFEYAFHLMGVLCAYGLGVIARMQRAYTAALEDRARRLEGERAADTARAIAQERSRIARDMHDILAHAVSLMVVQAEAGPVVVRSDPARAEAAFDAIAETGRDAMSQLRRILGVLKEDRLDGSAHRHPQPGPESLATLIHQVTESTGLHVELRTAGIPRPLPPDTGVAAYRVVQEALTNTVKHAYATGATVALDWTEEELTLTITDDGRGPAGSGDGAGLVGWRSDEQRRGGRGPTAPGAAAPGGGAPGGGAHLDGQGSGAQDRHGHASTPQSPAGPGPTRQDRAASGDGAALDGQGPDPQDRRGHSPNVFGQSPGGRPPTGHGMTGQDAGRHGPSGHGVTGQEPGRHSPTGHGVTGQDLGGRPPSGHGLIGIRERAVACGGTADVGPGPDGGFRVVVRLPVVAEREAALG